MKHSYSKMKNKLVIIIRRYELIIGSFIIIFFVIALSIFSLLPNFVRTGKINSERQVLRDKLSVLKEKDNRLASLDNSVYQSTFVKINQLLPEGKDYVSLFSTFDALEQKTGVKIVRTEFQLGVVSTSSARLARASGGIPAYIVPLTVGVQGESSSIQKFIESLRDFSGRIINVEEVKLEKTETNISQVAISGQAFFYPLSSTLGKVDSPLPKLDRSQEEILNKIAQITPAPAVTSEELDKVSVGKKNLFQ